MSFGKMNAFIDIISKEEVEDNDGYSTITDVTVASVRAYREYRSGTKRWANRALFSEATNLFRFRCIPGVTVTTAMTIVCDGCRFAITSVEDVGGRGMYIEVLAKEIKQTG
jgi:head-tail adaptor